MTQGPYDEYDRADNIKALINFRETVEKVVELHKDSNEHPITTHEAELIVLWKSINGGRLPSTPLEVVPCPTDEERGLYRGGEWALALRRLQERTGCSSDIAMKALRSL